MFYFCKLPQSTLSQGRDEGFEVGGVGVWGKAQLLQKLCGMKYMHKAKRGQQADKLTTPQPWHRWHLDTYQCSAHFFFFLHPVWLRGRHGEAGLGWGCFYAGELWAVEFNLGFTSDIVPPWLSSYWGQVYGVRQWGLFLVISRPATSHAQSIIAHSIMYQSLQTPSISADPFINQRSNPHLHSHLWKVKPLKQVNN